MQTVRTDTDTVSAVVAVADTDNDTVAAEVTVADDADVVYAADADADVTVADDADVGGRKRSKNMNGKPRLPTIKGRLLLDI